MATRRTSTRRAPAPSNAELAQMIAALKAENEALRQQQQVQPLAEPGSLQQAIAEFERAEHLHEVKSSMNGPCQIVVDGKVCGADRFAHLPADMGQRPLVVGHSYHPTPFVGGKPPKPGFYGKDD